MSKSIVCQALDMKVLAVAVINEHKKGFGDWCAYIGAVPGHSHEMEKEDVAQHGSRLDKKLADYLFGGTIERWNKIRAEDGLEPLLWRS